MDALRKKRQAMQEELEELESREFVAQKSIARAKETTSSHQLESETLRRSCGLTEFNLDKKEDLLEEKLHSLKDQLLRNEREEQIIKVLTQREMELEDEMNRLEPRVKQATQRADEAEMKYHEVVRKLALTEGELLKTRARQNVKEHEVQVLEDSLKKAGRQIRHLEVEEEKSGDREDKKFHYCQKLIKNIDHYIMRAEEAERKARMLQQTYDSLEKEKIISEENCQEIKNELADTLKSLDQV